MIKTNLKEYFDPELKSVLVHAAAGAVVGYASFVINQPLQGLLLMIVVMAVTTFSVKKIFRIDKKYKWFLSNGIIVYLFLWLVVWTIFYNMPGRIV